MKLPGEPLGTRRVAAAALVALVALEAVAAVGVMMVEWG